MHLKIYLQGDLIPACYDYDMDLRGILVPSPRPIVRNKGLCLVVLCRGVKVPTAQQRKTIRTIKTVNRKRCPDPTFRINV
jgi:hypothetical protein